MIFNISKYDSKFKKFLEKQMSIKGILSDNRNLFSDNNIFASIVSSYFPISYTVSENSFNIFKSFGLSGYDNKDTIFSSEFAYWMYFMIRQKRETITEDNAPDILMSILSSLERPVIDSNDAQYLLTMFFAALCIDNGFSKSPISTLRDGIFDNETAKDAKNDNNGFIAKMFISAYKKYGSSFLESLRALGAKADGSEYSSIKNIAYAINKYYSMYATFEERRIIDTIFGKESDNSSNFITFGVVHNMIPLWLDRHEDPKQWAADFEAAGGKTMKSLKEKSTYVYYFLTCNDENGYAITPKWLRDLFDIAMANFSKEKKIRFLIYILGGPTRNKSLEMPISVGYLLIHGKSFSDELFEYMGKYIYDMDFVRALVEELIDVFPLPVSESIEEKYSINGNLQQLLYSIFEFKHLSKGEDCSAVFDYVYNLVSMMLSLYKGRVEYAISAMRGLQSYIFYDSHSVDLYKSYTMYVKCRNTNKKFQNCYYSGRTPEYTIRYSEEFKKWILDKVNSSKSDEELINILIFAADILYLSRNNKAGCIVLDKENPKKVVPLFDLFDPSTDNNYFAYILDKNGYEISEKNITILGAGIQEGLSKNEHSISIRDMPLFLFSTDHKNDKDEIYGQLSYYDICKDEAEVLGLAKSVKDKFMNFVNENIICIKDNPDIHGYLFAHVSSESEEKIVSFGDNALCFLLSYIAGHGNAKSSKNPMIDFIKNGGSLILNNVSFDFALKVYDFAIEKDPENTKKIIRALIKNIADNQGTIINEEVSIKDFFKVLTIDVGDHDPDTYYKQFFDDIKGTSDNTLGIALNTISKYWPNSSILCNAEILHHHSAIYHDILIVAAMRSRLIKDGVLSEDEYNQLAENLVKMQSSIELIQL